MPLWAWERPPIYSGGAIANTGGTATVTSSTFSGNKGDVGAIVSTGGALNVTNSTFSHNSGAYFGGAIYTATGTATVSNSVFSKTVVPTTAAPSTMRAAAC